MSLHEWGNDQTSGRPTPTLERFHRFSAGTPTGDTLMNVAARGDGLPLEPRSCNRLSRDLDHYSGEQISLQLKTWKHSRDPNDDAVPHMYPRLRLATHSTFVGEVESGADMDEVDTCACWCGDFAPDDDS